MTYNFDDEDEADVAPVKLPTPKTKKAVNRPIPANAKNIAEAGKKLGFVDRSPSRTKRRKTGPKQTEPQDRISLSGPKRVLDRLKARADEMDDAAYWEVIEYLLETENPTK